MTLQVSIQVEVDDNEQMNKYIVYLILIIVMEKNYTGSLVARKSSLKRCYVR